MADQEVEEKQFEVEGLLYQQNTEKLVELFQNLKVPGDCRALSKAKLVHKIIRHLEKEKLGLEVYQTMAKDLVGEPPAAQIPTETSSPILATSSVPEATDMWRRELKISGQIGDPGQKDKLTFLNLALQMETAIERNYSPRELTAAVVRAITPGHGLRSYLEGRRDLTLPILRQILRCHYQERSATELYNDLTRASQGNRESDLTFLVRMMDLRQKVQFASKEADSGIVYDAGLIQQMFLRSVETGLGNESIRNHLIPFLRAKHTTDEQLLSEINKAVALENERGKKRRPKANAIQVNAMAEDTPKVEDEKPAPRKGTLMEEIKELRADIASIKHNMSESTSNHQGGRPPFPRRQRFRGCKDCRQKGYIRCNHCLQCGAVGHWKVDCPERVGSGNDQRPPRWDA